MNNYLKNSLVLLGFASFIVSCEQELDFLSDESNLDDQIASRTIVQSDSVVLFRNNDLFPEKNKRTNLYAAYDEYYSSNMYAIRELDFALKVRGGVPSTAPYLYETGVGKELILNQNKSFFYMKILPSVTGIPYLLYSKRYNKPLVCAHYTSNPNNNLVFVWNTDDISSGSWDLIPASTQGYFAIENQTYYGMTNPDDPWSLFNYVIEAKDDGTVGYAQYTKKPEQEFLIELSDAFTIKKITFDEESAIVTETTPVEAKGSAQSSNVLGPNKITIYPSATVYDTSSYRENGALKISNYANGDYRFLRPAVLSGEFISPDNFSVGEDIDSTLFMPGAVYSPSVTRIERKVVRPVPITVNEPSLVRVTSYYKTYNVTANYTVLLTLKKENESTEREVRLKGTWNGVYHTNLLAKDNVIEIKPLELKK